MKNRQLIGRTDIADFPDLGLYGIKVKVDTGADTSSIHASRVKLEKRGDLEVLVCEFRKGVRTAFTNFTQTKVRSSNGQMQVRYVVNLSIELFGERFLSPFTLSKRSNMNYPVLLGRKFLRKRFVVDVALKNVSFKRLIKLSGK